VVYRDFKEVLMRGRLLIATAAVAVLAGSVAAAPAAASHSWGNYHWARTSNPFTVPLGDNVTNTAQSDWQTALGLASSDWTGSTVLDSPVVPGGTTGRKCRATNGRIEVCNARYGFNGWLGVAQIWLSGSHIVKGTAKMNDSYFDSSRYDATAERHVMCQEIGHGYGLDHQDESGADLDTCMDYSDALDNPSPNEHDYDQLETIYGHLDSTSTVSGSIAAASGAKPVKVKRVDRVTSSTITEYFADGSRRVTFIDWAI
jgi:hypothetical protein